MFDVIPQEDKVLFTVYLVFVFEF